MGRISDSMTGGIIMNCLQRYFRIFLYWTVLLHKMLHRKRNLIVTA